MADAEIDALLENGILQAEKIAKKETAGGLRNSSSRRSRDRSTSYRRRHRSDRHRSRSPRRSYSRESRSRRRSYSRERRSRRRSKSHESRSRRRSKSRESRSRRRSKSHESRSRRRSKSHESRSRRRSKSHESRSNSRESPSKRRSKRRSNSRESRARVRSKSNENNPRVRSSSRGSRVRTKEKRNGSPRDGSRERSRSRDSSKSSGGSKSPGGGEANGMGEVEVMEKKKSVDRSVSKSRKSRSRARKRSRSSRRRSRSSKRRSRSRGGRYGRSDRSVSYDRSRKRRRSRRRERSSSSSTSSSESPKPRARSTSSERMEKKKKMEMMELTRDHRTVFVGQLQQKVKDKHIMKYFKQLGPIESVLLIKDKFTGRSKGIAYVEMTNLDDVPKVLLLNQQVPDFQVFPIMVKASEAEKNFVAKKENEANSLMYVDMSAKAQASEQAASRIYCGNLHRSITDDDIRAVFQSFGDVVSVSIEKDDGGNSKGFGYIQFRTEKEAKHALDKGDGLELAGNYLKLSSAYSGRGKKASGTYNLDSWKLDDDEGVGLQLNSQSRTALMAKLAGGEEFLALHGNANPAQPKAATNTAVPSVDPNAPTPNVQGTESFCFVLKNMFDPAAEISSDWHVEIKSDVESECSKYGKILHSYVEKDKPGGLVYILYDRTDSAAQAVMDMHGRWFNKRQITVRYMASQEYIGMFPESRAAVQHARENDKLHD